MASSQSKVSILLNLVAARESTTFMQQPPERFESRREKPAETNDDATAVANGIPVISALVVEPTPNDAASMVGALIACRFRVSVADTFPKARMHLYAQPPAALVTAIRLAEYNGLHLVRRAKWIRPEMAAIVVSRVADSVLSVEAEEMGATFVLKPVPPRELRAALFRTICRRALPAELAEPMRPPFERRNDERRIAEGTRLMERRCCERRRDLPALFRSVSANPQSPPD